MIVLGRGVWIGCRQAVSIARRPCIVEAPCHRLRLSAHLLTFRSHGDAHHDESGQNSLSERFARGESFTSIFLSGITKASGRRISAVAAACAGSWFNVLGTVSYAGAAFEPIGAIATVIGGWPVIKHGFVDLKQGKVTLSLSMSIGILAALGTGETFTSSLMTLVVLISEELEHLTVQKAQYNISSMLDQLPTTATLVGADGSLRDVPLSEIHVDDIIRVRPGGLVPVDGTIVVGSSFVNEAQMTGESMPVEKQAGSAVFAGSINGDGVLDIRATAIGDATVYGQVLTTVRMAENKPAPVEALADRVAKYVVYFAFASSAATLALTGIVSNATSVLVVCGACGIAAGTPLAIVGGIGNAARHGCVVKGGRYFEALANVDTIIFDKTGTLTYGQPQVVSKFLAPGVDESRFALIAAAVESRSEHPLASAVVQDALGTLKRLGIEEKYANTSNVDEFFAEPGRGVQCLYEGNKVLIGNRALLQQHDIDPSRFDALLPPTWSDETPGSEIIVVENEKILGALLASDSLRPEAAACIARLKQMGITPIVLSGDHERVVTAVSNTLGIPMHFAAQSPIQKSAIVQHLMDQGKKVAMVGDGVNDAGAMSKASVGIAMGSGSMLTQHAAQVVLLHDTLEQIPTAIRISQQARNIIYQNMAGTLVIDALGSFAAFLGVLPPALAAFFHGAWDIVFILNSARLLAVAPRRPQVPDNKSSL